jgi:sialate O-acetylesterase
MALWALAKTCGMEKIHYRSPEFKKLVIEGQMAIVEFEMFGSTSGLTTHDASGKPADPPSQAGRYEYRLSNFLIAGEDKRFHKATAVLASDKVYLFSPAVKNPVAVRYCFDNTSLSEIFSVEGDLPVSSFRTDDWEK